MSSTSQFKTVPGVMQVLSTIVRPMLASPHCIKCVKQEGETIYTNNILTLLTSMDIEHPAGEIIMAALEAQYKEHHGGLRTMLFFTCGLVEAVGQLRRMGISQHKSFGILQTALLQLSCQLPEISSNVVDTDRERMHSSKDLNKTDKYNQKESVIKQTETVLNVSNPKLRNTVIDTVDFTEKDSSDSTTLVVKAKKDSPEIPDVQKTSVKNVIESKDVAELDIPETDIVYLKMLTEEIDDCSEIDWFFSQYTTDDNSKSDLGVDKSNKDKDFERHEVVDKSKDQSADLSEDGSSISQVSETSLPAGTTSLKDGSEHDSDFEDCFDDINNRQHVHVIVEPISFATCADKEIDNSKAIVINASKHFPMISEFEGIYEQNQNKTCPSDVCASLSQEDLCSSDDEFSECFGNNSVIPSTCFKISEEESKNKYVDNSLCIINPHLDLIPNGDQNISENHNNSANFCTTYCEKDEQTSILIASKGNLTRSIDIQTINDMLKTVDVSKRNAGNVNSCYISRELDKKITESLKTETDLKDIEAGPHLNDMIAGKFNPNSIDQFSYSTEPINKCLINQTETGATEINDNMSDKFRTSFKGKSDTNTINNAQYDRTHQSDKDGQKQKQILLDELLSKKAKESKQSIFKRVLTSSRHFTEDDDHLVNNAQFDTTKESNKDEHREKQLLLDELLSKKAKESKQSISKIAIASSRHFTEDDVCSFEQINKYEKGEESNILDKIKTQQLPAPYTGILVDDYVRTQKFMNCNRNGNLENNTGELMHSGDSEYLEQSLDLVNDFFKIEPDPLMTLIVEVYQRQQILTETEGLNLNLLDVVTVSSSCVPSAATVHQGLLIPCDDDELLHRVRESQGGSSRRTVLLNGDLTMSFHHKGYKPTLKNKTVIRERCDLEQRTETEEVYWAKKTLGLLESLDIEAIFVRGEISNVLEIELKNSGILAFCHVSYQTLNVVSHVHKIPLLLYMSEVCTLDICSLQFNSFSSTMEDTVFECDPSFDKFCLISNLETVQTFLIRSVCAMSGQTLEERLWHCIHTLHSVLNHRRVVPGSGLTESWCARRLRDDAENILGRHHTGCLDKPVILEALADIFQDFSTSVKLNLKNGSSQMSHDQPSDKVDDLSVKVTAWESALDVAHTLLSLDSLVVTGLSKEDAGGGDLLF